MQSVLSRLTRSFDGEVACGYNEGDQVASTEVGVEVGVRELRNHLSRYLERVRSGEEMVVTDRGHAIARVLPISGERALDRFIAEGMVSPASRPKRAAGKPIKTKGIVSDLIAEQRR